MKGTPVNLEKFRRDRSIKTALDLSQRDAARYIHNMCDYIRLAINEGIKAQESGLTDPDVEAQLLQTKARLATAEARLARITEEKLQ
jgi:hypothetical protein